MLNINIYFITSCNYNKFYYLFLTNLYENIFYFLPWNMNE